MTLELYYNTELGAVIDRNKYTRYTQYVSQYGFSILQYSFWRIIAPLVSDKKIFFMFLTISAYVKHVTGSGTGLFLAPGV